MNWLAKINLKVVSQRLGSFKSALFLFILISLCVFVGYRLGNYYQQQQLMTLAQQKERLEQLYTEQSQQLARIHTLEVELAVEQLANQEAQAILKESEQEHFEVKKQLAFYEKVMAPEKDAGGLVIDNVKIVATRSAEHYQFQVALVQQQLKRRYSKGSIELTVSGSLAGKPKQLKLNDIAKMSKKELSFNFQYFQVINGEVTLPKGFIAEEIHITATLPKARWQKYYKLEKSFPWKIDEQL
ncbi:DUF6776 family protein [Colwellia sp. RSH04]|uniref:DUF6776 family protein n=1 Tax=Colwellia sp. RSH04 TaxID=2305464 RepID=UPI000E594E33|nr:DUF6776 family protein [Colwellia sp. RSH04]RHW76932.1 hypothetical protein D1094_07585 [Colwellia sp. RSH04]